MVFFACYYLVRLVLCMENWPPGVLWFYARYVRKGGRLGALDKKHKKYFKDPRRFADAWNGLVFGGLEVIRWQELSECDSVLTYAQGKGSERIADAIMKKTGDGKILAIMILENQKEKDYGIPVKVNLEEALAYDAQASEIKRRNSEVIKALKEPISAGELLYLFRKTDRLRPVVTLVLYWNDEEWDGANSLDELIDFRGAEELRPLVTRHPVRVIDVARLEDTSCLKTDLRSVIEYFKRRNDKEAFREYYENCESNCKLGGEGLEVVSELVKSRELINLIKKAKREGEEDEMCKAITELIEEGKQAEKERADAAEAKADAAEAKACEAQARADLAAEEIKRLKAENEELKKKLREI